MALKRLQYKVFSDWLQKLPVDVAAELEERIVYLCEFGRESLLPDVRHEIMTSRNHPEMSEVRADLGSGEWRRAMRVLTCFVEDGGAVLVCVGGDKHGYLQRTGRDWYDDYVPVADAIVKSYYDRGGK